ncbi:TlpA family protein disulfide reductase [Ulvibacter antarcticus]|uniref:Thiol-disulfide isomerase/thioredoxin n=1 Tax=Ulvibacter antarcticus TaxID=442714 RepID=A0A3L9YG03_9FLAO|nr:TlpA disulfide reductase family protein [Ulvibacter antarcticus]RMA58059.1 thiol-disulfide isomerase/thioredoxin [Ulvibacter antarcticus]
MKFIKKHWGNIAFFLVIGLLIFPPTAIPIKVFITRVFSFSPSEVEAEDRAVLDTYDWQLTNLEGETINFSQSEGKVVVLNLWATWCPPCIAEMPSFQKLYDAYGDRVDFYFVSSEEATKIKKFLQKKKYNFPVYLESQAPPKMLQSKSIPKTYLISKSGMIVMNTEGAADWNSETVHQILDKLLAD